MNDSRKKWILFCLALALMAGAAGALTYLKNHQRLGPPGLKAEVIPGSVQMKIELPARVLDFDSTNLPTSEVVLGYLPKDTSYAQRLYFATNGDWATANIILMGEDRTSIHRPDYCLPSQGWQVREQRVETLAIGGSQPYELPVGKWTMSMTRTMPDGTQQPVSSIYVFWFVTEGQATASFPEVMRSMLFHLVRHGVLQRWAYVSWFSACPPGREEATYARMKELIVASVPEFQKPLAPAK